MIRETGTVCFRSDLAEIPETGTVPQTPSASGPIDLVKIEMFLRRNGRSLRIPRIPRGSSLLTLHECVPSQYETWNLCNQDSMWNMDSPATKIHLSLVHREESRMRIAKDCGEK